MIRFVKGNLLESTAQALVNTVNTVGVMGKSIALQFKEAYPNNYILYRNACKDKLVQVGSMFITQEQNVYGINKIIVNFLLELLSTVDFILHNNEDLKEWLIMQPQEVFELVVLHINQWSERKKYLFNNEEYIRLVLNHLYKFEKQNLILRVYF